MKNLYLEKILEIHKSFCLITGLNSIIIDKNGEILSAQSPSYTFCNRFISLNKNNINVCKGCELKKIDINTENIHERCCFPFWSCNVPIKVNGETVAKIFIGEALSDKLNDNELKYIRDNYDKIKLIIIDAMGNDAGINAARDWNNKYGYKIILISQRLHFRDTLAGFPFIKKPIDKRRLLNTVEQELYRI